MSFWSSFINHIHYLTCRPRFPHWYIGESFLAKTLIWYEVPYNWGNLRMLCHYWPRTYISSYHLKIRKVLNRWFQGKDLGENMYRSPVNIVTVKNLKKIKKSIVYPPRTGGKFEPLFAPSSPTFTVLEMLCLKLRWCKEALDRRTDKLLKENIQAPGSCINFISHDI